MGQQARAGLSGCQVKCPQCGFAHEPDDIQRCRNARALGLKLAARLNVSGVPNCTYVYHAQIKQSLDAFVLSTRGWREQDDEHEVLLQGNCRRCDSTLYYFIRNSDARLAAAVDALKGTP